MRRGAMLYLAQLYRVHVQGSLRTFLEIIKYNIKRWKGWPLKGFRFTLPEYHQSMVHDTASFNVMDQRFVVTSNRRRCREPLRKFPQSLKSNTYLLLNQDTKAGQESGKAPHTAGFHRRSFIFPLLCHAWRQLIISLDDQSHCWGSSPK